MRIHSDHGELGEMLSLVGVWLWQLLLVQHSAY